MNIVYEVHTLMQDTSKAKTTPINVHGHTMINYNYHLKIIIKALFYDGILIQLTLCYVLDLKIRRCHVKLRFLYIL